MKAVTYNADGTDNESETFTTAMYNYKIGDGITDSKDSIWANAKTEDGSYWVWIPRYAYKIIYYEDEAKTKTVGYTTETAEIKGEKTPYGDINILFMYEKSGDYYRDIEENPKPLPEGFKVHPAFQKMITAEDLGTNLLGKWNEELEGIWVAKYEASMETSEDGENWSNFVVNDVTQGNILTTNAGNEAATQIRVVSKPSAKAWTSISQSNIYLNSINMYEEYNSHQMKNSEYGAVAYLTESAYGRNGNEVGVNQNYIVYNDKNIPGYTGGGPGETADVYNASAYLYDANTFANTYKWNTTQGQKASTTGNIYGIYDMVGGAWEYTANYINGGNTEYLLGENAGKAMKESTDYKTLQIYEGNSADRQTNYLANAEIYGDAVYETSMSGIDMTSWHDDYSYFPIYDYPFYSRGGNFADGNGAGLYYFGYATGYYSNSHTFRPVLALGTRYEVTFNANGGEVTGENEETAKKTVTFSKNYGALPTAYREGYKFAGWFTADGNKVSEDTIVDETAENQVLYAKWEEIVYSISYDLNNGTDSNLSEGYTLLTHIESTGTQYIDTGYVPNQNTTVIMDYENKGSNLSALFGARKAIASAVFGTWIDNATIYPNYGDITHTKYPIETTTLNNRLVYALDKNVATANGITTTSPKATFSSTYTLALLTMNTSAEYDSRCAIGKLYSCQIYDNGNLVRYLLPCKNNNGEVGLYDTVSGSFYTNKGTGTFIAGNEIKDELPNNYEKLPYIESTGTQFIDTGFIPNQNTRVIMDYEHIGNGSLSALFGARPKTATDVFGMWIDDGIIYPNYGDVSYSKYPINTTTVSNRLVYEMKKNVAIANGKTSTSPSATFNSANTLTLLTMNTANIYDSRCAAGKLYSCQIYDNGTLVRYYIPCVNPNGEIGLYDTVNNVFYGNAGTGTFERNEKYIDSFTVNSDTITLPVLERNGYEFLGWTGSNGETPQTVVTIEKGSINDRNYTANWEAKTYKVTLEMNDGKGTSEERTVTYGESYGELPTPTRTGYTFLGWYNEMFTGTLIESTTTVNTAKDHIIYAHWLDPELIFGSLDDFRTIAEEDCEGYTESHGTYNELYTGNNGEIQYNSDGSMKFDQDNPILFLEVGENTDMFADEYSLYFTIKADTMQYGKDEKFPGTIASIGNGVHNYLAWIGIYKNYLHVYSYRAGNSMSEIDEDYAELGFISKDISQYSNKVLNIQVTGSKTGTTNVYLNGELFITFDSGGSDIETTHVTIGDLRPLRNLKYQGKLYDFAMYRRILTDEEIATNWEFAKNKWIEE